MGMYHELVLNVDFKESMPKDKAEEIEDFMNENFFYACYYFKGGTIRRFEFDKISENYKLSMRGTFKNYEDQIDTFLNMIKDWLMVDDEFDEFLGYYRYEEEVNPTLLYSEEGKIIKFRFPD